MLAVGGAAAVTMVTVAGALGIGPGAAVASTGLTGPSSPSSASPLADAESAASQSGSSGGDRSWLTIDHGSSQSDHSGSASAGDPPDSGDDDTTSSQPAVPAGSGHGKRVVFDQSDQRVWLVDAGGEVMRTYLVSGSKHDNLQPGTYEVYSKSLDAVSFDGRETMRYMVRFTHGAHAPIGFHDIPRRPDGTLVETRDQLGTPLSAGCIRQWEPDAKAMWAFAPVGTTVVVVA
jgi:lipoprotein-anchoring transpeptidase ErfK/SrfK